MKTKKKMDTYSQRNKYENGVIKDELNENKNGGDEVWDIETIKGKRYNVEKHHVEFRIRWKYDGTFDWNDRHTWEPAEYLFGNELLVHDFNASFARRKPLECQSIDWKVRCDLEEGRITKMEADLVLTKKRAKVDRGFPLENHDDQSSNFREQADDNDEDSEQEEDNNHWEYPNVELRTLPTRNCKMPISISTLKNVTKSNCCRRRIVIEDDDEEDEDKDKTVHKLKKKKTSTIDVPPSKIVCMAEDNEKTKKLSQMDALKEQLVRRKTQNEREKINQKLKDIIKAKYQSDNQFKKKSLISSSIAKSAKDLFSDAINPSVSFRNSEITKSRKTILLDNSKTPGGSNLGNSQTQSNLIAKNVPNNSNVDLLDQIMNLPTCASSSPEIEYSTGAKGIIPKEWLISENFVKDWCVESPTDAHIVDNRCVKNYDKIVHVSKRFRRNLFNPPSNDIVYCFCHCRNIKTNVFYKQLIPEIYLMENPELKPDSYDDQWLN